MKLIFSHPRLQSGRATRLSAAKTSRLPSRTLSLGRHPPQETRSASRTSPSGPAVRSVASRATRATRSLALVAAEDGEASRTTTVRTEKAADEVAEASGAVAVDGVAARSGAAQREAVGQNGRANLAGTELAHHRTSSFVPAHIVVTSIRLRLLHLSDTLAHLGKGIAPNHCRLYACLAFRSKIRSIASPSRPS